MAKKYSYKSAYSILTKYHVRSKKMIAHRRMLIFIIVLLFNLLFHTNASAQESIEKHTITSEAAILIEEGSGRVLYEKNADQIMYPASLTKVATSIYAIERGDLEDIVTVSEKARMVDGTRVYLEVGEKVPLKKLIQGLLINSGNDAGIAIAEHLDGSEEEFAKSINSFLQEVGLKNTNFTNSHGLFDPIHVTSARDLALITQYAMKNSDFREIFGMKELKWVGEGWDTTIYNHHKLMRERPYEGITGGKNGYVDKSLHTLITTAKRGNLTVIAVVLKGQSQDVIYNDTVGLLDYAFNNFELITIPKGKEYSSDGKMFITSKANSIPVSHSEEITEAITNEGILEIKNQFLETILSFQLNQPQIKDIEEEVEEEIEEINNGKSGPGKYLPIIFIITFIGIYLFYRKKKFKSRLKKCS